VGKKTGKNPTDRGKLGVKRSMLTDRRGMPIGLAVAGANVHDQRLAEATLDSIPVRRPRPSGRRKQHLCGDKGYDANSVRRAAKRRGYTTHIPKKGDKTPPRAHSSGKPRRWVVERIHSWLNRYRRILVRWEKKAANYIGLLHLVFAHVLWRNC
jgi:putative transposase